VHFSEQTWKRWATPNISEINIVVVVVVVVEGQRGILP